VCRLFDHRRANLRDLPEAREQKGSTGRSHQERKSSQVQKPKLTWLTKPNFTAPEEHRKRMQGQRPILKHQRLEDRTRTRVLRDVFGHGQHCHAAEHEHADR